MKTGSYITTTPRVTREAFQSVAKAGKEPAPKKNALSPFSMRLTEEERKFLDEHCGSRPWASYIRERVFNGAVNKRRPYVRPKIEDQVLAAALSGLGQSRLSSNLNQLAKSANIGALEVNEEIKRQLEEACTAIVDMRNALMTALGLRPGA